MKKLLLFILLLNSVALLSQTPTVYELIRSTNRKVSEIRQGWFDCTSYLKTVTRSDTHTYSGRIYFFREPFDDDSIGQFVLQHAEGYCVAYDGSQFFRIPKDKKLIYSQPVSPEQSIHDIAAGTRDYWLLNFPFMYSAGRSPFRPYKFDGAKLDTVQRAGEQFLRITRREFEINEKKLLPTDPDTVHSTYTYEFTLPDLTLRRISSLIIFTDQPQYNEKIFSAIHPLSDSITFHHIFNIDSLLAAGYTSNRQIKPVPAPVMVAAGDTLPAFRLIQLDGSTLAGDSLPGKLVLLDFWYKGCAPCLMALPCIKGLYSRYQPKGLEVFGVNVRDKDTGMLKAFAKKQGIQYPLVLDPDQKLANRLHLRGYPSILLVEPRSRRVLYASCGYGEDLEAELTMKVEKFLR